MPALFLAAAVLLPPARPLPFEICLLHRLTGLPCLTCGLTRAACFFAQGEVAASLAAHPAGPLAVVLLAVHVLWRACEATRGRALAPRSLGGITAAIVGGGAILSAAVWLVRLARI